ncbi:MULTISPECIES: hypothetical protein [unclassified Caballeronia]|uniref:hypothetical protein n=1 Tax=unclassified Caballeronia TaxID=2646786 RepID=UPI002864CD9F|nr:MULTISPECIES: hypothetical protein [unclassified Caballeronia]MDR5762864.1 hypothetical protein [Caballeronia sp. LZ035]MDR5783940.1 hypothetical protein [Caballeronia sp. LZ065]
MNKLQAQALLDFADAVAMADVATRYGSYDPFRTDHGDLYWKSFIGQLAEQAPYMGLPDIMALAES